ncbi:hypothetical protein [Streptomyces sp. NPDC058989]|uniref:hypothetical protein n=1 Tax=Streptomyces sp. NPDC058989 TaxID=3346686 RepID=UPI0036BBC657
MADVAEERRIGDTDPRITRLQRKRWLIAAVIVLVVGAPSIFYFSGAYDRWQDSRSLADICRGSVDTSEVKELLGIDRLRGREVEVGQGANPHAGQLDKCSLSDPDRSAWLSVAMDWGADASGALHDFGEFAPWGDVGMAIPLGHGWEGVMDEGGLGKDLVATINLPCVNHRNDTKRSSLVVTVQGMAMRSMEGTAQRTRFARTATKTAQNAAKAWGCTARVGGAVERVPDNTAHTKVPEGEARGTCAGIATAVRESAADSKAPIENCYLLSDSFTSQYRVSAFYAPFATALAEQPGYGGEFDPQKPAGHKGTTIWASAQCSSGSRALYIATATLNKDRPSEQPDVKLGKVALKEFAARSAKRHGCTDLKLP